jgi:CheY-like chemotaxis protein
MSSVSNRRPFKVLVADDSPLATDSAVGILAGRYLEVISVPDGKAAIKKLSAIKPDLVIADVRMPGKDGYEVCEYVKHQAALSKIPVLLITSDPDPYDEKRGSAVSIDGTIQKPFRAKELKEAVAKVIRMSATEAPSTISADNIFGIEFEEETPAKGEVHTKGIIR